MFTFTPYYDPSLPLWEVVANSMSYFWKCCHYQKVFISGAVHSLLPTLTYPWCYTRFTSGTLVFEVPTGFTLILSPEPRY